MGKYNRNPAVRWRTESHREERAREVLGDPARAGEVDQIGDLGTVTLLSGGVMHQLNLLGGEVWKLCDGSRDFEDLVRELAALFEVEETVLRSDLEEFLTDMAGRGLLNEE